METYKGVEDSTIHTFSKIRTFIPLPNLIEVQKKSYESFLQMNLPGPEREDVGVQSVFQSVFPISDFRDTCTLEFVSYSIGNWECKCGALVGIEHLPTTCRKCGKKILTDGIHTHEITCHECGFVNREGIDRCEECGEPVSLKFKFTQEECQERGMTYAVPLKVTFRLIVFDRDPDTGVKSIRDIKEQEVYFGEVPIMTEKGTFIINGTERVIVNQLHRSPGVFFQANDDRTAFVAKIIPYRGSWVEFEYETSKNLLYVRIDRKRKFLATTFLRALGLGSNEEILRTFYRGETILVDRKKLYWRTSPGLVGVKVAETLKTRSGETIVGAGKKLTRASFQLLEKSKVDRVAIEATELEGAVALADIVNKETGEVLVEANELLTPDHVEAILQAGIDSLDVTFPQRDAIGQTLHATLKRDALKTPEEARAEIYRRLRPGDPPTMESSRQLFESMFFDPRRYDFSRVGRLKFNTKLGLETDLDEKILHPEDFFEVIRYLLRLQNSIGTLDDIDHLGNRRVRSVGELLENQFRIGLVRMEIAIKEKMSVHREMTTATPQDIVNAKPVIAAIQEFFGSSQLSQFMDQTNPLSEVTHKRRLSALGPGGLSRERAGFEVRDVHPTHYGRVCPIETPEGPNIGLISSLSCYARINEFGFIESPYRKVEGGRVVDYFKILQPGESSFEIGQIVGKDAMEVELRSLEKKGKEPPDREPYCWYQSAWEEDKYVIGQANVDLDEKGLILNELVTARHGGSTILTQREKLDFIDVSPKQLVSVATALIPFLENDDANRALMGSNMQRQAVPLLGADAPIIGTGMEAIAALDSGAVVTARRDGVVDRVDGTRIIVRVEDERAGRRGDFGADIYSLTKFKRSNQNTCMNQSPIVREGDRVRKGQVIADGPCTDGGELALGRNVLVAFMPWRGYNFEDAILVSEKLVREDYYTSIHIEEFEIEARDTKLGPEEITRDIPNVSENFLRNLDEAGIIRIGAYVRPGDVLVGKVTPKGETQLTPEEKLLRAIFGEKSGEVRDASLLCPPGIEGTIVDVKVFARKGVDKDTRQEAIEREAIEKMCKNLDDEIRILKEEQRAKIIALLQGQKLPAKFDWGGKGKTVELEKGASLTVKRLEELPYEQVRKVGALFKDDREVQRQLGEIERRTKKKIEVAKKLVEEKSDTMTKGYELAPGVRKLVKVYVAMKRKLSVGDKMAGRHGNKGVIARILPVEDMPCLPDGTPIEIVLNPLGVPSRMNVGQILETHLGWAGKTMGVRFYSPVFDGATEREIKEKLRGAGLPESGKILLRDGRTGDAFEQRVTVGYLYMMKLSHLVDDKIHARSIGPYSLITQQPLGGKAQFGGQRFGEMEVWALEAYGAAHTLQELLTAKSDDVFGRTKIYEAIVKGEVAGEPGIPESFNVLTKELQSLCLDVQLFTDKDLPESGPLEPVDTSILE